MYRGLLQIDRVLLRVFGALFRFIWVSCGKPSASDVFKSSQVPEIVTTTAARLFFSW